ncbi:MAG: ATP-dependent helicase [Planctomycetota bacterium]|nr:MAG: ATP-dependent helicase [Planctomycetota bacterium]
MAQRRKRTKSGTAKGRHFGCRVLPSGRIVLVPAEGELGVQLSAARARALEAAFASGPGHGLLHLAVSELEAELPTQLAFWRELGRLFLGRACASLDPEGGAALVLPKEPSSERLAALADSVPPMPGAEYVDQDLLKALWGQLGQALLAEAGEDATSLAKYLKEHGSVWHVLGRVCLHLAENKNDPERPFAFIATYVHGVSAQARAQHLPLGRALEEYAGTRKRQKLLALLAPLSRGAEASELLRELVDKGDVYQALAWTAEEAYRFLLDAPKLEQAGLLLRLPDWWSSKKHPRPTVSVTIGEKAPSNLGLDALLDFEVSVSLGGRKLSAKAVQQLLAQSRGLVLIKGRWVEVDPSQLAGVLEQWESVQEAAGAAGLSFGQAMRLLAGAQVGSSAMGEAIDDDEEEDHGSWAEIVSGDWLRARLKELRSPEHIGELDEDPGLRAELRPYQQLGLRWLRTLRGLGLGACLADDMGLGKTIQVIALMQQLRLRGEEGCDLLVVPASLLENWRLEIERFAPGMRVLIAHPSRVPTKELPALLSDSLEEHDAVITSYGTAMRLPALRDIEWRNLVLDEAQAIKNPAAKQSKAVKSLKAGWRLALTGTPVENQLGDLWSIFDFLNPGLLGSRAAFDRFCKTMQSRGNGFAPLRRLVQPYILRRLKTDKSLLPELPDKSEVSSFCLLSEQQAALYEQSVQELREQLQESEGMQRRGLVLGYLLRFKQICNHPAQWLGATNFDPAESGKFLRLRELCEAIAARQDKMLVFTQFREMCAPLASFLSEQFGQPGLVLHGGTPVRRRQELVRRFQEEEDAVPFMVLSLKAGGTGLNLTAASHVVHFDRWWNPAVENQATDRAYRIGQHQNVLVHKFICRGTIEERVAETIEGKQRMVGALLAKGAERGLTELEDEELLKMLTLDMHRALEK